MIYYISVFSLVLGCILAKERIHREDKSAASFLEDFKVSIRSVDTYLDAIRFEIEDYRRKSNWTSLLVQQFSTVDAIGNSNGQGGGGAAWLSERKPPAVLDGLTLPLLLIPGKRGQSCDQVCHSTGRTCRRHFMSIANTCDAMRGAFNCEGACLSGYGEHHPAAVLRRARSKLKNLGARTPTTAPMSSSKPIQQDSALVSSTE